MKKLKIITLLVCLLTLQGIYANAASSSSKSNNDNEYTKEEIENRRPGFWANNRIVNSLDDVDQMSDGFNVINSDPNKVVYTNNGQFISGWIKNDSNLKWYYFDPETHFMVRNQAKLIDGKEYYFLYDGTMALNCNINGSFYGASGAKEINSINPHYRVEYLIYPIKDRNDYCYMFTSEEIEKLIADGKIIINIETRYSYLQGVYYAGTKQELNLIYIDKDDNSMLEKDGWYYNSDKTWSYYKDGDKVTGWVQIYCTDGPWYYFDNNGIMAQGNKQIDGSEYYFDYNGIMQTGWRHFWNYWYYYNQDGTMASNTTVDGYKIGANGYYCK